MSLPVWPFSSLWQTGPADLSAPRPRLRSRGAQQNGRWFLFFANFASLLLVARLFVADLAEAEKQLAAANTRLEQLLENMLPPTICQRLRREGRTFAEAFATCSVLFADIVGYTSMSESVPNVVHLLDADLCASMI